jgi:hypothetical protein
MRCSRVTSELPLVPSCLGTCAVHALRTPRAGPWPCHSCTARRARRTVTTTAVTTTGVGSARESGRQVTTITRPLA